MKRLLAAIFLLLFICAAQNTTAQNYDNLEPLTLLNRSVLDKSCRAIQRDDISTRDAIARLVSEADRLMGNPVKSVRTKGYTVEVRFTDGGKDRITFSVEGKQLKTLTFKSKDKQFSILK